MLHLIGEHVATCGDLCQHVFPEKRFRAVHTAQMLSGPFAAMIAMLFVS
jgi:Uncharacterized protein containing a Zn-ribbon (DUF2116)